MAQKQVSEKVVRSTGSSASAVVVSLDGFAPVLRQSLPDDLAYRIKQLMHAEGYEPGARLPTIVEMARRFGVGAPTLREALKKLETVGAIEIKHGSGVYAGTSPNTMLISNPVFEGSASKKLLLDLIEARMPIEIQSVVMASKHASEAHLDEMRRLLASAEENLDDDGALSIINMTFHRQIALASGNVVSPQILEVLSNVFRNEQRIILSIYGSRRQDHAEHLGILEALQLRDENVAAERMRTHLEGVRRALLQWNPRDTPIA
jgi:GntR family transcriptional repressor for pyruvate dehydrogenase complex